MACEKALDKTEAKENSGKEARAGEHRIFSLWEGV